MKFGIKKQKHRSIVCMVWNLFRYLEPRMHGSRVMADRRTDGRTDRTAFSNSAL